MLEEGAVRADPGVVRSAGRRGRWDQAGVSGLVDPGDHGAAHVVDEVAPLAAATLVGSEAVGDELVATVGRERVGPRRSCA